MAITIWHNPRCSKSRAALSILEEAGATPTVREYLKDPLTADEIRDALRALGLSARDLVRTGEDAYAGLEDVGDEELIEAMAAQPILIERPVVFGAGRAVIGRPPDVVRSLLD